MEIEGLDYNTQREKLLLPEYGREVQSMVDYAMTLTDRAERQRCANSIVAIMKRMFPQPAETEGYDRKLWDHLALMSGFKLDIVFEVFETLKTMEKGREYDELGRLAAHQMKRDLVLWGHGSTDDEKVASDLAGFTDGRVQLDLSTFRFDRVEVKEQERRRGKKR